MSHKVHPLRDNQALAVEPGQSVWLSASAGTGKTQVLSARVLRLLLTPGVGPESILCLTFTKAGAAEMAERVNGVLASWVRMKEEDLGRDLIAIGADATPESLARARTLFARVLDCPGGGLRIDTIHAFSQWLLGAFPEEAGLLPGTRAMEDRDRDLLAHRLLAGLVAEWEAAHDRSLLDALELLSLRMGADGTRGWLMRCALARDAWFGPGGWQEPLRNRVEALLGLPADAGPEWAADMCSDEHFDAASLRRCMEINAAWKAQTGQDTAARIGEWLEAGPAARAADIDGLYAVFHTGKGELRKSASQDKIDPDYPGYVARVAESISAVRERAALLALVDLMTPALTVGRQFALAWDEAKQREGLVDFDDLIRMAAALLAEPGLGEWIRYKLDRQFDHILVDEAQDTNAAQWSIVDALVEDFYTGEGQGDGPFGGHLRTLFVVGDYKQAIFRFQGTSPENFEAARRRYHRIIGEWADNARALADETGARDPLARPLADLDLGRSYRTAQPVLDFVDKAIGAIGADQIGLTKPSDRHIGFAQPGLVTLWHPVGAALGEDAEEPDEGDDGPEQWLSKPEREMADRIATQVRQWLDEGYPLHKYGRNAGPGDVMVLVRKRRDLAGLIVARLHAKGVPVAGVDRLRLGAPLAVKDLMAALRFAAQPRDDLSLAALLVSPLIGWSQQQLLDHAWREQPPPGHKDTALWEHLWASTHPDVLAAKVLLEPLLARADFETPQALLHWLMVGPWQARRKLTARLGREANDPLDELLNAALAYASAYTPSLQGFIRWFDAGANGPGGELKREADGGAGLVRVMTVHGAKGLQAPIVILADATGDPDSSPVRGLELEEDGKRKIPVPGSGKDVLVGPVAEAEARARAEERQEHWRLLYVAMTRAEEALFIGGALGTREDAPAEDSWYARLAPLMTGEKLADPLWGARQEWGARAGPVAARAEAGEGLPALPHWALAPVGPEPRPPRPLAPSSAGDDQSADPPLPPDALARAARRGVLMHRLLERLPELAPDARAAAGEAWLARQAADLPGDERGDMLFRAMAVLAEPGWAGLFGPAALAEVPLAALVDGQVIAGTADRLLVLPDRVLVADFKTARRPPSTLEQVPAGTLRQMGAYAAALAQIYPGRRIEAALLYTQVPLLIPLSAELLAAHKPALSPAQESLAG